MKGHKFKPETTNGGYCFSDCSCGEQLGVYEDRTAARAAHTAHINGKEPVGKVHPFLMIGGPIVGQEYNEKED